MKTGDEVISLVGFQNTIHAFPKKNELPKVTSFPKGSKATIEEIYPSGYGIVRFENGERLLTSDLINKFVTA
jgi:hypothetical protein